ncbi:MAG: hypothetical protein ACREET_10280 [Stellaceae bacterium]
MKHAGSAALQNLGELLERIRMKDGVREKKLGVFFRKSKPFLHFHEDPAGLVSPRSTSSRSCDRWAFASEACTSRNLTDS